MNNIQFFLSLDEHNTGLYVSAGDFEWVINLNDITSDLNDMEPDLILKYSELFKGISDKLIEKIRGGNDE